MVVKKETLNRMVREEEKKEKNEKVDEERFIGRKKE